MSVAIFQGDTIDVGGYLVAGESEKDVPISANELGWLCRAMVLDHERNLISERRITEIQDVEGSVPHFVAKFTIEESLMMGGDKKTQYARKYYWAVEVSNEGIDYKKTLEVELVVTPKPESKL